MARPATASSIESSPLLLLLCGLLLLVELLPDHQRGRCWPVYPGGGAEDE